jgi:hypothetical protein
MMAHITLHLDGHEAEAVLDATISADDAEYPEYVEAFASVQHKAEDALNGEAGPPDCCVHCIEHRYRLLDHELHDRLMRAARDADYMILGSTLHTVDGCHVARGAHPATVEVGAYRGRRIPVYVTGAEAERWLSASPKRKRCKRCAAGV